MSRNIRKVITFSDDEYNLIEKKLDEYQLKFATFARSTLLKEKIYFPFKIQALYHLNNIQIEMENIAKGINTNDKKIILFQLSEIENKLNELL